MNGTLVVRARIPREGDAQSEEPRGSSTALARLLVELEQELERERPARVVLADDSDAALAAAIVAAKLLIPVEAEPGIDAGGSVNARLISQLTSSYTPQG